ncbi:MAG: hypothetical protein JWO06_210 [Bacteroidota bacterium]|nr:hypothetical protein [Bacteroidota bacterium]
MKKLIFLLLILCAGIFADAQTTDNLLCRLKKDTRATNVNRQNENIPLKKGEQYVVEGTSGKMVVIKVGSKSYFISTGSIDIFKTEEHKSGRMLLNDTIPVPLDTVGKYKIN